MRSSSGSVLSALLVMFALQYDALAQSAYPARTIRIIVPTASGGGNDMVARLVAQGLSERLGRQVIAENRPGAGTIIGTELVAKSPADGYTLLMAPAAFVTVPLTNKKAPYDAVRDFAPITQAASLPSLVVVHPSVPARSVKEMIALAKAKPGQILFGSAGLGTQPHLSMELFASMANLRMIHVPYKGSSPGLVDLLAGQLAIMAANMPQTIHYVRAGRLRALGVTTASRVAAEPEIPTIAESGLPGYESVQWFGLLAPAGTPREIIARLHKESIAILRMPENIARLAADGAEVTTSSPEEFAAFIQAENAKWAKVVKAAGIQPE
jgi:tripartite-type tricarboxylate transporter receptor subunit TctC